MRRMLIHITGMTATNRTTASADPRPRSEKPNARWNISLAMTCVPKLPLVIAYTMSKTFITVTNNAVITTPTVGAICGKVIFQNTCDSVAPSTLAASINSVGTALMAADRMTIAKPTWTQISTTINHMLLNGASWTNSTGCGSVLPLVVTKPPRPGPMNR